MIKSAPKTPVSPRLAVYEELLANPAWLATFHEMSSAVVARGALPAWLARGYFGTLVAGALKTADTAAEPAHKAAAATLSVFLALEPLYRDGSGVPLLRTVNQLLPSSGYKPLYSPKDVKQMLHVYREITAAQPAGSPSNLALAVRDRLLVDTGSSGAAPAPSLAGPAIALRESIALWYAGGLLDLTETDLMGWMTKRAPIQCFESELIWGTFGAVGMGRPGPFFGNWAYPPPDPVVAPSRLVASPVRTGGK